MTLLYVVPPGGIPGRDVRNVPIGVNGIRWGFPIGWNVRIVGFTVGWNLESVGFLVRWNVGNVGSPESADCKVRSVLYFFLFINFCLLCLFHLIIFVFFFLFLNFLLLLFLGLHVLFCFHLFLFFILFFILIFPGCIIINRC